MLEILNRTNKVDVSFNQTKAGAISIQVFRPGNGSFDRPICCQIVSVDSNDSGIMLRGFCDQEAISVVLELAHQAKAYIGKFIVSGEGRAVVRLVWELPLGGSSFPFVPAFMYGYNSGGRSPWAKYPQLDDGSNADWAKPWVTKEWFVRADRSSHCMTAAITDEVACAVGGRDVCRYVDGTVAEKNGLGISSTSPPRLSFLLGFANIPFTYCTVPGRNFISRPEGYVNLDKGQVVSDIFLSAQFYENRHKAACAMLRKSYGILHDEITCSGSLDEAITTIATALVEYGYCKEARNFYTAFNADRDRMCDQFFSSGWAGGCQVAYPLLLAGHKYRRADWVDPARTVLSNVADNGICSQTGLFYENFDLIRDVWSTRGWWYEALDKPGHSGYVNGQVCHYLLQSYLLEKRHGFERANWLDAARAVLDHIVKSQADSGGFGYTYSEEDGNILDANGFCGAWFVPALGNLYRITGEKKYLDSACRAMDFYRTDVEAFCVYGGPHDIFKSPDEEGILAWIRASHILHEATGNERFLKDLLIGLEYELSWKFAYNVVNEVEPLKSLNWSSTGGSVTSVNNPHIHPMGSMIISSLHYAYMQTKDEYLRSRLIDTVRWTFNAHMRQDGQFGWGKKGMINERFCHTDAVLHERFANGSPASTWFCAHSWASGSVLEGLMAGEHSNVEELLREHRTKEAM